MAHSLEKNSDSKKELMKQNSHFYSTKTLLPSSKNNMRRYGCRFGLPHEIKIIHENQFVKWEACEICNVKFRWNKGYKGRTDNKKYLEVHARNFAQPGGPTNRLYQKIYNPENCIINL